MRLRAIVPATAANLGPGFDCFGLALDLCNEVTVDTDGEPGVRWEGEGADELPTDGSDLLSRTMGSVATDAGRVLPPIAVSCLNRIPLARGLGSSAAAVVAAILLAGRLLDRPVDPTEALLLANRLEGHPDNAAAALLGGLVLAFGGEGAWRAERIEPSPDLRPVVLVPEGLRLSTADARRALPAQVPLADAAFNVGRAALAVVALTARPHLLPEALQDRLHQPARLPLVPRIRDVFEGLRDAGVPVCVSGAGPSLLAFELGGREVPDPGDGWTVLRPGIRATGAEVEEVAGGDASR